MKAGVRVRPRSHPRPPLTKHAYNLCRPQVLCDKAPQGLWTIITFIMLPTVRSSEIHMDCSYDFRLSQKRNSRIGDEHGGRGSRLPISKGHITIITGTW